MFLTLLLIDFFHEDWSARSCELYSERKPFRVRTGDYRPLPAGAMVQTIGAESIFGGGWDMRVNSLNDPVDRWLTTSDDRVKFEIKYDGVTPPNNGIGAYNLILPHGWRFDNIHVVNLNHSGPADMVGRDDEADQEALMLYFQGANTKFNLTIEAARGSNQLDRHDLGVPVNTRRIVEPGSVVAEISVRDHPAGQALREQAATKGSPGGEVHLVYLPRESSFDYGPWPNKNIWLAECQWAISGGGEDFCILRAFLRTRRRGKEIEGDVNPCTAQKQDKRVSASFPLPRSALDARITVTLVDNTGRHREYRVAFDTSLLERLGEHLITDGRSAKGRVGARLSGNLRTFHDRSRSAIQVVAQSDDQPNHIFQPVAQMGARADSTPIFGTPTSRQP